MKLYVGCGAGLAADMFVAALLDTFDDKNSILRELELYISKGMCLSAQTVDRHGIIGTRLSINSDSAQPVSAHSHGRSFAEVLQIIDANANVSKSVKKRAEEVYLVIAQAECKVHGADLDRVHFHEVGSLRAIAGVVCACALYEKLDVDHTIFSPVNVGYGTVECAHGLLPVPAPATAAILKDIPVYSVEGMSGELCTPTGAAFAKYFADGFSTNPPAGFEKAGVGIGARDTGAAGGVTVYKAY